MFGNEKLQKEIQKLTQELEKQNSPARSFGMAVLKGFGVALGGTVVVSIAAAIFSTIFNTAEETPLLDSQVSEQLQEFTN